MEILASLKRKSYDSIIKRALELEKIGLRQIDALHVACAEKSVDVMLTM